jgi:hypothetical protein
MLCCVVRLQIRLQADAFQPVLPLRWYSDRDDLSDADIQANSKVSAAFLLPGWNGPSRSGEFLFLPFSPIRSSRSA